MSTQTSNSKLASILFKEIEEKVKRCTPHPKTEYEKTCNEEILCEILKDMRDSVITPDPENPHCKLLEKIQSVDTSEFDEFACTDSGEERNQEILDEIMGLVDVFNQEIEENDEQQKKEMQA